MNVNFNVFLFFLPRSIVNRTDVINLDGATTTELSGRLEELKQKVCSRVLFSCQYRQISKTSFQIKDYERQLANDKLSKEYLQVQIKILEDDNATLRDVMSQMRKRAQDYPR